MMTAMVCQHRQRPQTIRLDYTTICAYLIIYLQIFGGQEVKDLTMLLIVCDDAGDGTEAVYRETCVVPTVVAAAGADTCDKGLELI